MNDIDLNRKYERLEALRKQLKESKKAMEYFEYLKELNKNDLMYGWLFDENAMLNDTLEDLDMYQKHYVLSVLQVYINELENILEKTNNL